MNRIPDDEAFVVQHGEGGVGGGNVHPEVIDELADGEASGGMGGQEGNDADGAGGGRGGSGHGEHATQEA